MLHQFLLAEREKILALCAEKLKSVIDPRSTSDEMDLGLSVFYDELVEVLRLDIETKPEVIDRISGTVHRAAAIRRGKESLRLGYTISQVVHGYGTLCQTITQYAAENGDGKITAREFNRLNFCLDVAIAEAVTEFSNCQNATTKREEVQRMGFLAHEMRNALGNAIMAHRLIKKGIVGTGGSTAQLLEDAHKRLQEILDRSMSEVRMHGKPVVERQQCRVVDLVGEVEATATTDAAAKSIRLHVEVAPGLLIYADRHLVVSAISNLVQNAIKFTKDNGHVWIRGVEKGETALIEIEDQCGGLPPGKVEELFQPFMQRGGDKTGLGLGLSISRRAVELNDGNITALDLPGKGCIFTIQLPKIPAIADEANEGPMPVQ